MSRKSPFPGMDPFLEPHWHSVHPTMLVDIMRQISGQLPDDLIATIEQSIHLGEGHPKKVDVTATSPRTNWEGEWHPAYEDLGSDATAIAEPVLLAGEEAPTRHLEIRSAKSMNTVVTVLEILSPSNKRPGLDRDQYAAKRKTYHQARINFVEIDLVRQGAPMVCAPPELEEPAYNVYVKRFGKIPEFYGVHYEDRLPRFRVPLRPSDKPAILDLQAVIDKIYVEGQFWKQIDYEGGVLYPPVDEQLKRLLDSC